MNDIKLIGVQGEKISYLEKFINSLNTQIEGITFELDAATSKLHVYSEDKHYTLDLTEVSD